VGTRDGLGAGWARSLRCSFSACALRILATISGLVFVGGGVGICFLAFGGADSRVFLTTGFAAGAAFGVTTFSGLVPFSSDCAGCLGDCLTDGLVDEWILVGFTAAVSAVSFSFFPVLLLDLVAGTDFGLCLLGLVDAFANGLFDGLAATAGFFVLGASCAVFVFGGDFGSGLAFTAVFVFASVFLEATDLAAVGFLATAGDFFELLEGAGDFRFLLSVFFRAVDNVETPDQAPQNMHPPNGGGGPTAVGTSSMVAERGISSDFGETLRGGGFGERILTAVKGVFEQFKMVSIGGLRFLDGRDSVAAAFFFSPLVGSVELSSWHRLERPNEIAGI
jgi:hypothetical protein